MICYPSLLYKTDNIHTPSYLVRKHTVAPQFDTVTSATARGEQDTDGKGAGDVPVNSASSRIRRISPSKDRQRTFVKILVGEQMFGDL